MTSKNDTQARDQFAETAARSGKRPARPRAALAGVLNRFHLLNAVTVLFGHRNRTVANEQAEITPLRAIHAAVAADDIPAIEFILEQHPELLHYKSINHASLLSWAAKHASYKAAVYLMDAGVPIDWTTEKGTGSALMSALHESDLPMAKLLLDRGANPNLGRTLFATIGCDDEDVGLAAAQLLVAHGVDVNRQFEWFGNKELTVTPLEFAQSHHKHRIAGFLRSAGATPRQ